MWLIFIVSTLIIAMASLIVIKIGHKVYLSMKKEEDEYNKTNKEGK